MVRACAAAGVAMVPQGGNTSMVGGAVPAEDGSQIVITLARMNRIRAIDPVDLTLTIEAGATLKAAQDAAEAAGCLLPLSIGVGGHGPDRRHPRPPTPAATTPCATATPATWCWGWRWCCRTGRSGTALRRLRKDNTGYCLRQLFVGGEGTLGIITAAVLKLAPRAAETEVALCAVASPEAALALFTPLPPHGPGGDGRRSNTCRRPGWTSCCATSPAPRCRCRAAGAALRAGRTRHARAATPACARRWRRC